MKISSPNTPSKYTHSASTLYVILSEDVTPGIQIPARKFDYSFYSG